MEKTLSNLTSSVISNEASCVSSSDNVTTPLKKKRNLPGHPDPDSEVIALSPRTLQATNRFVCDICNKGFQRDQNLQLHRRGHNLPWKLKQRSCVNNESGGVVRKKVYVCPETTCVHHEASRALGDLTGIKKHFSRKHGEKKWKCEKCSKKYAVQSDWKAHAKVCGTREYRCDCATLFSRRDSFITHRAFCGALAEENTRKLNYSNMIITSNNNIINAPELVDSNHHELLFQPVPIKEEDHHHHHQNHNFRPDHISPWLLQSHLPGITPGPPAPVDFPQASATALLQKAAQMGGKLASPAGAFIFTGDATINASSSAVTGAGAQAGLISAPPSSSYLRGFDAPANFDETLKFFEQFSNSSMRMMNSSPSDNNYGDGQTQTRDFLGLRGFSESDQILISMAGLSEYMNTTNNNNTTI